MTSEEEKVIADLAFNLGTYIFQFTITHPSPADELIDLAMDDIDATVNGQLAMRVRAAIVRGYQSAGKLALAMEKVTLGLVKN